MLRRDADRLSARDEIRFIGFQELYNGRKHRRLPDGRAQVIGGQPGQRQQALRAIFLGQGPGKGAQGQRFGVIFHIAICNVVPHRLDISRTIFPGWDVAKKVLVVEDNDLNRKLFCDLLRAHDYAAEPVADGREALAAAQAQSPDLIIMDIQMPHVSGLDLIHALKKDDALKAIPIMAVTAYAAKGDEERIRAAGAESYVSKPISVMKFVEEVRNLV